MTPTLVKIQNEKNTPSISARNVSKSLAFRTKRKRPTVPTQLRNILSLPTSRHIQKKTRFWRALPQKGNCITASADSYIFEKQPSFLLREAAIFSPSRGIHLFFLCPRPADSSYFHAQRTKSAPQAVKTSREGQTAGQTTSANND